MNKVSIELNARPLGEGVLIDGRTYAPVRLLCEALGLRVDWRGSDATVILTSVGDAPEPPIPEGWLEIIPQKWVKGFEALPDGWLAERAPGLLWKVPRIGTHIRAAAKGVGVSEKLLVTRMQLEQSALTYRWDESTNDYGGGLAGEEKKLCYLCGVDRTDSGDREGGWFGPEYQLLGCALRFGYWYRGRSPENPEWRNWLGLREDPAFASGVPVTRAGMTIIPANQASADCLRYTTSMSAQHHLREIGLKWFPEDYQ